MTEVINFEHTQHPLNWVDPDVLAYEGGDGSFDQARESEFTSFFREDWLHAEYDHLRVKWDPLLKDSDPHGRLFAKTALWSVVRVKQMREGVNLVNGERAVIDDTMVA